MPIRPEGIPLGKDSPKESFGPLERHPFGEESFGPLGKDGHDFLVRTTDDTDERILRIFISQFGLLLTTPLALVPQEVVGGMSIRVIG